MVDIASDEVITQAPAVTRLLYLTMLLAVMERSMELSFEPSPVESQWKLRLQVGGADWDLAPVPLHVPVIREIIRLAGLGVSRRVALALIGRLPASWMPRYPRADRFRLIVAGAPVDLSVTIRSP